VLDVGTRRIVHWNVTEHPTEDWTIQQCRTAITGETAHRFLIHDRDAICTPAVDRAIRSMGLRVLKTPVRTPQANAYCERVIGTIRRECLDWLTRSTNVTSAGSCTRGSCTTTGGVRMPAWAPGFPTVTDTDPAGAQRPSAARGRSRDHDAGPERLHHEYHLVRNAA
jgi:putative transposase